MNQRKLITWVSIIFILAIGLTSLLWYLFDHKTITKIVTEPPKTEVVTTVLTKNVTTTLPAITVIKTIPPVTTTRTVTTIPITTIITTNVTQPVTTVTTTLPPLTTTQIVATTIPVTTVVTTTLPPITTTQVVTTTITTTLPPVTTTCTPPTTPCKPYASTQLDIQTDDGSGQVVHPSIVYIPDSFNSWTYWMAITPYPDGNCAEENPSIYASNDGINWVAPLTNPVEQSRSDYYNSDPNLEYFNNELCLYYREYSNTSPYPCDIALTTSADGVTWTTPQVVVSLSSSNRNQLLSPSVILDDDVYKLYYVSFANSTKSYLYMSTSSDGITWSSASKCVINGLPSSNPCPWHLDIKKNGNIYQCFLTASSGEGGVNATDFYAYSTDGLTWTSNSSPLMTGAYSFDNSLIYKGCMLPDSGLYRIWYSCENTNGVWSLAYTEGTIKNNILTISSSLVY